MLYHSSAGCRCRECLRQRRSRNGPFSVKSLFYNYKLLSLFFEKGNGIVMEHLQQQIKRDSTWGILCRGGGLAALFKQLFHWGSIEVNILISRFYNIFDRQPLSKMGSNYLGTSHTDKSMPSTAIPSYLSYYVGVIKLSLENYDVKNQVVGSLFVVKKKGLLLLWNSLKKVLSNLQRAVSLCDCILLEPIICSFVHGCY